MDYLQSCLFINSSVCASWSLHLSFPVRKYLTATLAEKLILQGAGDPPERVKHFL